MLIPPQDKEPVGPAPPPPRPTPHPTQLHGVSGCPSGSLWERPEWVCLRRAFLSACLPPTTTTMGMIFTPSLPSLFTGTGAGVGQTLTKPPTHPQFRGRIRQLICFDTLSKRPPGPYTGEAIHSHAFYARVLGCTRERVTAAVTTAKSGPPHSRHISNPLSMRPVPSAVRFC